MKEEMTPARYSIGCRYGFQPRDEAKVANGCSEMTSIEKWEQQQSASTVSSSSNGGDGNNNKRINGSL